MPVDVLDWLHARQPGLRPQGEPMLPMTQPNIVDPKPVNRIQWQQPTMAQTYAPAMYQLPVGPASYYAPNSSSMTP